MKREVQSEIWSAKPDDCFTFCAAVCCAHITQEQVTIGGSEEKRPNGKTITKQKLWTKERKRKNENQARRKVNKKKESRENENLKRFKGKVFWGQSYQTF